MTTRVYVEPGIWDWCLASGVPVDEYCKSLEPALAHAGELAYVKFNPQVFPQHAQDINHHGSILISGSSQQPAQAQPQQPRVDFEAPRPRSRDSKALGYTRYEQLGRDGLEDRQEQHGPAITPDTFLRCGFLNDEPDRNRLIKSLSDLGVEYSKELKGLKRDDPRIGFSAPRGRYDGDLQEVFGPQDSEHRHRSSLVSAVIKGMMGGKEG